MCFFGYLGINGSTEKWSIEQWVFVRFVLCYIWTPKWMVYDGKTLLKWMIWGYHYFRKHPYGGCVSVSQRRPVIHKPQKIQMTLAVYKKLNYEG